MTGLSVFALLFLASIGISAPAEGGTLFGLVDTGELYASTNSGVTWTVRATLPANDFVGIAAATASTDLCLLTRSGSVYRSSDGGSSWAAVGTVTASDVAAFTLTPGGEVLALTETGTLYRSTDGGVSFSGFAALTGSNWLSLTRGPMGRLYALTRTGEVAESQDWGAAWTVKGAITTSNAVSIGRRGNNLFVLMATGEVARSTDYGATWATVAGLTQSGMSALAGSATLAAAAETGEVATSADGVTWTWVGAINQLRVIALGEDTPIATGILPEGFSPPRFAARPPYPNPSTGGEVAFRFELPGPDRVRIDVYDMAGRLRASRAEESFGVGGAHDLRWTPRDLPAGTYLVRFATGSGRTASAKWSLIR